MKDMPSIASLKNESYKRYQSKSVMHLEQFNKLLHKNRRKATDTMCAVYFDILLRENTTYINVKCQSNDDFNSDVRQCLIILIREHGVNLPECLTVSDFKMAGISTTLTWSLCRQLSGSLTNGILKVVLYFHTSCIANVFYLLRNKRYSVKPRVIRTDVKALKYYSGKLHHQRKNDYCFVSRCCVQSLFSHIHRNHLLKQTRKLVHSNNELCWTNDVKIKTTANANKIRYTVLEDYC